MAKNLNSVTFTVLLVVLVLASNGILKSNAFDCTTNELITEKCLLSIQREFLGECGTDPFTGTDADCCACCKATYTTSPNVPCWAAVEGTVKHCHCYKKI